MKKTKNETLSNFYIFLIVVVLVLFMSALFAYWKVREDSVFLDYCKEKGWDYWATPEDVCCKKTVHSSGTGYVEVCSGVVDKESLEEDRNV